MKSTTHSNSTHHEINMSSQGQHGQHVNDSNNCCTMQLQNLTTTTQIAQIAPQSQTRLIRLPDPQKYKKPQPDSNNNATTIHTCIPNDHPDMAPRRPSDKYNSTSLLSTTASASTTRYGRNTGRPPMSIHNIINATLSKAATTSKSKETAHNAPATTDKEHDAHEKEQERATSNDNRDNVDKDNGDSLVQLHTTLASTSVPTPKASTAMVPTTRARYNPQGYKQFRQLDKIVDHTNDSRTGIRFQAKYVDKNFTDFESTNDIICHENGREKLKEYLNGLANGSKCLRRKLRTILNKEPMLFHYLD